MIHNIIRTNKQGVISIFFCSNLISLSHSKHFEVGEKVTFSKNKSMCQTCCKEADAILTSTPQKSPPPLSTSPLLKSSILNNTDSHLSSSISNGEVCFYFYISIIFLYFFSLHYCFFIFLVYIIVLYFFNLNYCFVFF